jgi:hypothetical protein
MSETRCPDCGGMHRVGGTGWREEDSEQGYPGKIGVPCPQALLLIEELKKQ